MKTISEEFDTFVELCYPNMKNDRAIEEARLCFYAGSQAALVNYSEAIISKDGEESLKHMEQFQQDAIEFIDQVAEKAQAVKN